MVSLIVHQNLECLTFYFHILGGHWLYYTPYFKRLLQDKPFSASASSEGHSASDARISSGSSWCAPVSDYKHYLQVDLGRLHYIYLILTYGDSTSTKWVATYNLNYTIDLAMVNWNTLRNVRKNDITNNNIIACTYLAYCCAFSLIVNDASLTVLVCRFKETRMVTIMELGYILILTQELCDSCH